MTVHLDRFPYDDPRVMALLQRVQGYYEEYYHQNGKKPSRFLVTEDEYRLLRGHATHDDPVWLFGMRVVKPERLPWYRDSLAMEHVVFTDVILEPCRTDRPLRPELSITCPCGEVIWELSPPVWKSVRSVGFRPIAGLAMDFRPIADLADRLYDDLVRVSTDLVAELGVHPYLLGLGPADGRPMRYHVPVVDSDESSDADWEAGVHGMLADARARRLAKGT